MSRNAELAAVLRRIAQLVSREGADVGWSAYEADQLRSEIRSFLGKAEADLPLAEEECERLRLIFAPTGALQETSIASGWDTEFLALAARFDEAI